MSLRVLIAGGGTGGHLYPGIAVAREILRRVPDARVSFVGTAAGLEARVVPREGFELDVIRSAGLKGKAMRSRLRGLGLVPIGMTDAWRIVSSRRPHVVIGVGGYSAGPVVLAAAARGIATMVLEQNAVPGLTNRLLARWVDTAAVTYESTRPYFGARTIVTGNPVRPEFLGADPAAPEGHPSAVLGARVLILGGSQGAHAINTAMMGAASVMLGRAPDARIVHQTGARDLDAVKDAYQRAGVQVRAEAFLDPIAPEMRAASLVICRAGATTLAELAALGRPAVLVPFPAATDDHQRKNARVLAEAGAAILLEERDLTAATLARAAGDLIADPPRLAAMRGAMRGFATPDAAARIVDRVIELAGAAGRVAMDGSR